LVLTNAFAIKVLAHSHYISITFLHKNVPNFLRAITQANNRFIPVRSDETVTSSTVREKILAHLAGYAAYEKHHQVPVQVSQRGIAEAVGIKQKHFSQYIRPMIAQGLVSERSSFTIRGKQHQKVYFLTSRGKSEANWMMNGFPESQRRSSIMRSNTWVD
jgi:hypothetical protein